MTRFIEKLLEQPYWILALVIGAGLVVFPSVTIDKNFYWSSHPPTTPYPVWIGTGLLLLSAVGFAVVLFEDRRAATGLGVDLTRVKETEESLSTMVGDCEVRVVYGHIQDQVARPGSAIALPCNEYFDDQCAFDPRSSLGAYVGHAFKGQIEEFISLTLEECRRKFGPGIQQNKSGKDSGESFGAGRCILLTKPLGRPVPVALVSTATMRAGEGLAGRISYLFGGMRELFVSLAEARLNGVIMPVFGGGHAGITPPLALVGLLLAVAEAARYGQGGQRLKRVTVVVYRRDEVSPALVDPTVVRRALAMIGS